MYEIVSNNQYNSKSQFWNLYDETSIQWCTCIYNNSATEFVIHDINTIANIYRNTQVSPISTCILHVRVIKK